MYISQSQQLQALDTCHPHAAYVYESQREAERKMLIRSLKSMCSAAVEAIPMTVCTVVPCEL